MAELIKEQVRVGSMGVFFTVLCYAGVRVDALCAAREQGACISS